MKHEHHSITHAGWVREDFSSGCSSGRGFLASLFALFVSWCFPQRANISVGDLRLFGNGAGALKSPASVWRHVVFVAFILGLMAMFASNQAHAAEYFAGTTNVPNATVQINGVKGTTNADGAFGFHAPRATQYAISVSKQGYALASEIVQWPSMSLNFTVKQAELIEISQEDYAKGVIVADSRDTQIDLPANAFGSVSEPINAYVYTYDLGNEPMPGDMTVQGRDGFLVSAGVFSAEFVGANSGEKYNLAADKKATISVPTTINGGLPELWYYDEATGKWIEEGSEFVELVDGRLQGKVSHFSTWNFDWYKSDPACIKLELQNSLFTAYGYKKNNGNPNWFVDLKAVVTSTSPAGVVTKTRQEQQNGYPTNVAIINIPPNSTADIYVRDPNGNFVLFDTAVNAGAASEYLPHPYNSCNGSTTLTGSPNIPIVPGFAKIVGKGEAKSFSWLLKDNTGVVANNSNAPTSITSPVGASANIIAANFANDINQKTGSNLFFSTIYDKIELGNHTLFVGKAGLGNTPADIAQMCQVNLSSPCAFNPDIQLVTKTQVLTTLDGFLWNDVNENGLRDIGEEYRKDWTVTLNSGQSVVTDMNGYYEFTGLSQGNYTITVETRTGVVYTTDQSLARTIGDVNDPTAEIPATANFGIKEVSQFDLTVINSGNGLILVRGIRCDFDCSGNSSISDNGIRCGLDCNETYLKNTQVTLGVTADSGYQFDKWTGDCSGTNTFTTVTMDVAKTCTANFAPITFNLTLNQAGDGNGTVNGGGSFTAGTTVNLTATPSAGSQFDGWAPAPCANSFGMPAGNLICTATFSKILPIVTLKPTSVPSKICKGQSVDVTFGVETTKTIGTMRAQLAVTPSDVSINSVTALAGGQAFSLGSNVYFQALRLSTMAPPAIDIPVGNTDIFTVKLTPNKVGIINFDFDKVGTWSKNIIEVEGFYVVGQPEPLTQSNQSLQLTVEDCGNTDNDADGVPDSTENLAPNNGDGNGDGKLDSQQTNVTSLPSVVTGDYVSLETTNGCPVQTVKSKSENDAGNGQDDPIGTYPQGLLEFDIPCQTANIKLFYHGVMANSANNTINIDGINYSISLLSYRKFGPNPPGSSTQEWYTLEPNNGFDPNLQFGTATIGGKTILTASFTLQDGKLGDDTGVDGIIYDDGGFTPPESPLSSWDGTLEGYKFIDTNNNGKYDNTSETLVEGRHLIIMQSLSSDSITSAFTDDGHYKFYDVEEDTYSMWQYIDAGWLAGNLTTEAEIKWSTDDPLTVIVSNDGARIDGNAQLLEKIDFPIPDFANQSGNVIPSEVKDKITAECENVDYVLCGLNSDDCLLNTSATVIDLTTTGAWPTTGAYGDIDVFAYKKISTFGEIYLPLSGNNQNVTVGSICNYGTLTLEKDAYYYHPVVMDFNYWFINYGEVLGASAISKWIKYFSQAGSIERIEIRSKFLLEIPGLEPQWVFTGNFYNEGTIQSGNGRLFNHMSGIKKTGTSVENKKLVGFPQLHDLLQLNQLAVFKVDHPDDHPCNDEEYVDGGLEDGKSYNYVEYSFGKPYIPEMPDGAALSSLHKGCYDYTNGGSINSLEPEDALSTGGDVRIEAANIYQNGEIEAGKGTGMNFKNKDDVPFRFNKLRFGGKGGDTKLISPNMVFTKDSTTRGGKGGDITVEEGCPHCTNILVKGGQGGNLEISPDGKDSNIRIYGELEGDSIYVEPDLMLAGKDTNIVARKDVVIFGGDNWKLVLNDLRDNAIVAGRDITLAVGEGGSIDLRGNTSKVFKAGGKVTIHADNVLLDEGVQLEDIIQANEIVQGPNKIIYRVVLDTQDVQGKANETIPVKLEVSNAGPKEDTYTLNATSKNGIAISGLPSSVTIEGLTREQLDLSVVLPVEGNDTITITATSQADPTVTATAKIKAAIVQETTAEFSVSEISGIAPLTVDLDASASVANGIIISYKWTASDGQTAEGQNAQLTFNEVGDYTITLEVIDDREATDSATQNVKVEVAKEYATLGTLLDKQGNPVVGATIEIDGQTTTTDSAGNWEISGLSEGEYTLNASKDGFVFMPQTIELGNEKYLQPVELKPLSELGVWVKPATRQPLKQGGNQRYTVTIVNGGESIATGITLSETLPEGSTLVSLSTVEGGECDAQTLTCQLPDLSTGQSARVAIEITDLPPNGLRNLVTVSSNEYPEDVKKTRNHVDPYLSVQMTDQPDPVLLQGKLHYEIGVDLNEYAPMSKATNVELTSRLPQGTQLDNVSTDDGQCTHETGVISCDMDDLSIANAADKSHATVNVDVTLQDAGLLILNHEATVKSSEYPSDMHREKTKVFVGNTLVDMVLVLDTTHSMNEEINGVIKALKAFIKEKMTDHPVNVALVEFKDDVILRAFSSDMETLLQAVENLEVSGGGTCPEASVEALNLAVDHLKDSGVIFFSTDASPYEEANVDALFERIKDKQIQVTAVISGDCSEGATSWNDIE